MYIYIFQSVVWLSPLVGREMGLKLGLADNALVTGNPEPSYTPRGRYC